METIKVKMVYGKWFLRSGFVKAASIHQERRPTHKQARDLHRSKVKLVTKPESIKWFMDKYAATASQTSFSRMFNLQRIRAAIAVSLRYSLSLALLRSYRRLALDFGHDGHSRDPSDAIRPILQTSSDVARTSNA
ncbi:MAG: hypothetical protein AAFN10_27735 [Bacteroidota bacterium]